MTDCLLGSIDKTSSAELSESINSMFNWYRKAEMCFIYLEDVSGDIKTMDSIPAYREDSGVPYIPKRHISKSVWFTRGWTLQELLAPLFARFYDQSWRYIGSKYSLKDMVSAATGIEQQYLLKGDIEFASVAKRMSWAAKRRTTRVEDMAYCLLGIFGVNMPLLYGEGTKAFTRLQEEIMK
jgi:hypothetical protein